MNPDPLLNTDQAAEHLSGTIGVPVSATRMRQWRHTGKGPEFVKFGGAVFYRQAALDAFAAGAVSGPMRSTREPANAE